MSAQFHDAVLRLARGVKLLRRHAALTGSPESEAWANELQEAAHQVEGYYLALGQERAGQLDAGDPAQPPGTCPGVIPPRRHGASRPLPVLFPDVSDGYGEG